MISVNSKSEAERQATIIRTLRDRYDSLVVFSKKYQFVIPTPIAVDGKAPVAAYMYTFHEKSKEVVAEELSVNPETVDQYLSDVISDRR